MIEIRLTQGKVAIIDDQDAHLERLRWQAIETPKGSGRWYARRRRQKSEGPGPMTIYLHRSVLAAPPGLEVDHQDRGATLDCRRLNLRLATRSENSRNKGCRGDSQTGFKGVHRQQQTGRYVAGVMVEGRRFHLGRFDTPEAAAHAYDVAAMELHGRFARVNFPAANEPMTAMVESA